MTQFIEIIAAHKKLAKISEALAHPTRVAILDYILSQEVCLCKDITKRLPIVQSSVSQHLKKLKDAHLILGKKDGIRTCYCVNMEALKSYKLLINEFMNIEKVDKSCCVQNQ